MINKRRKKKLRLKIKNLIFFIIIVSGVYGVYNNFTKGYNVETAKIEKSKKNESKVKIPPEIFKSEDPTVKGLLNLSLKYPAAKKILSNLDAYPSELLELAAEKEETIEFVSNYPENTSSLSKEKISIKKDYEKGEIPLFMQWDERWGYDKYGNDFMAINGCGPTALAMVVVGLTGDIDVNPKVVADYSRENGYLVDEVGSSWTLMSEGAKHFGVEGKELSLNPSIIKSTLKKGTPIIASMKSGNFTKKGHFIVLTGITEDGKIIVNDSDSKIRSEKQWDIDVFMNETANLWKFEKA